MGPVYDVYLALWKSSGAQLLMHHTNTSAYTVYGRFGSLEYMDLPRALAPKYDALMRFIESNRPWWQ